MMCYPYYMTQYASLILVNTLLLMCMLDGHIPASVVSPGTKTGFISLQSLSSQFGGSIINDVSKLYSWFYMETGFLLSLLLLTAAWHTGL